MARGHPSPSDTIDLNADAALLEMLTGPVLPKLTPNPPLKKGFAPRRDDALDPLLLAAAASSGPNATRNHYTHDFFPGVMVPQAEGAWDWSKWKGEPKKEKSRLAYASRQAPRSRRLREEEEKNAAAGARSAERTRRASGAADRPSTGLLDVPIRGDAVAVKCMARTRIPTPHGPAFLHLYHNNRDRKEHLALVVDPAQFAPGPQLAPPIRSRSLDAVWSARETEMDRITRGAYVGRLSASAHAASVPHAPTHTHTHHPPAADRISIPAPLVRIHSECFTGETVGSLRCDCGEQLDEAIRLISQPITITLPATTTTTTTTSPTVAAPTATTTTIPGRGAVVYLRQEGRGIGLLAKLRAYNLQDLGHDTVAANLLLGHGADERGYEAAGAVLRDLGLGGEGRMAVGGQGAAGGQGVGMGVRLLTNNPDKVRALQREGLHIAERVPMVPRSWQGRDKEAAAAEAEAEAPDIERITQGQKEGKAWPMVGAGAAAVHGEDLEKYLRTKVLRMGHLLPLYLGDEP